METQDEREEPSVQWVRSKCLSRFDACYWDIEGRRVQMLQDDSPYVLLSSGAPVCGAVRGTTSCGAGGGRDRERLVSGLCCLVFFVGKTVSTKQQL